MCCCTCCLGTKRCMCWFIFASVLSLIVLGCCIATYAVFGGPVPTERLAHGFIVVFFANACTLVFSVVAILFVKAEVQNVALYILVFILLIGAECCSWYTVYAFHDLTPSVEDVQDFTVQYSRENDGDPPPFLDYVQLHVPICCGAVGFQDYVPNPPKNANDTFDVPDSCCLPSFGQKPKEGCWDKLTRENYEDSLWFHEKIGKALEAIQKAKSISEALKIIEERFKDEIQTKASSVVRNAHKTAVLHSISFIDDVKEFIPSFLEDQIKGLEREARKNAAANSSVNVAEEMEHNIRDLLRLNEINITSSLPINVYGCARIVSDIGNAELVPRHIRATYDGLFTAILIFVTFQAAIHLIGFVFFNVYYCKGDIPVPAV